MTHSDNEYAGTRGAEKPVGLQGVPTTSFKYPTTSERKSTAMNWEPMTEDAVFEDGEELLACQRVGFQYGALTYDSNDGLFYFDFDTAYSRSDITHFARITNPNEVKP